MSASSIDLTTQVFVVYNTHREKHCTLFHYFIASSETRIWEARSFSIKSDSDRSDFILDSHTHTQTSTEIVSVCTMLMLSFNVLIQCF